MTDSKIESLWPEDFGTPDITPPVVILRQQATILSQKTRNMLEGVVVSQPYYMTPVTTLSSLGGVLANKKQEIVTSHSPETQREEELQPIGTVAPNAFHHSFYVKALALGGYRYNLFSVNHKAISVYPLNIGFEASVREASNEEEFRNALRDIFASEKTRKVIQSLMAQSLASTGS